MALEEIQNYSERITGPIVLKPYVAEEEPKPYNIPPPEVILTPTENTIRELLVYVVEGMYAKSNPSNNGYDYYHGDNKEVGGKQQSRRLTLRFTGDWVANKVLGKPSKRIDVSIDRMIGYEFAQRVYCHLVEYGIPAKPVLRIGNGFEMGVYVQPARMNIMDVEVNFVNLTAGRGSGGVCVLFFFFFFFLVFGVNFWVQTFGTPLQDASRRDSCVGALFYNIHTRKIEDFTRKGLQDLNDKYLRTPQDAFKTLSSDPVHVLRLLYHSLRMNFQIHPQTEDVMENIEIKVSSPVFP
jgi:tRNA nucleotidyltransferase (CCA-adding enzyme)